MWGLSMAKLQARLARTILSGPSLGAMLRILNPSRAGALEAANVFSDNASPVYESKAQA